MTETLCNTVGSISSFSKIEKGISSTDRILKDRTLATNVQSTIHKTDKHTSSYTFSNFFVPVVRKLTPLPELNWADSTELWNYMLEKYKKYAKDPLYLRMHKQLQPRMRSILLDWLIEVCEVYRLHRETFSLAVDFIDRYLSTKQDIPKQRLQLIGTTALFIASKIEEIYPPKLSEFAYVTDGACTESEILQQELIMLKQLNWNLCPVTCNTWLNIYLQLYWLNTMMKSDPKMISCNYNFVYPEYSQQDFLRVAQLLDLCCLDIGSLQFSYSIIASSALYHMIPVNIEEITGHKWEELFPCIQWMSSFSAVIRDMGNPVLKTFEHVKSEDSHNIQTHINNLTLLEKAQTRQCVPDTTSSSRSESPPVVVQHFAPLTPPSSTKKAQPT
ncbi:G1/S-specific cyclin-E1-like isoform X2 [Actinia tenebrosa]|nr:G1/S-specific cyclin-E1-like isoform X2 [Actinia tenebrosa]XP_031570378.1 G1/S-specific cyclin-E1-like isoform X2 [Actinia tenebrosa]